MKKTLFYLFLLMAVVAMPLTSCKKNNGDDKPEEGQHDPNSDSDQTKIDSYDALSWLQGSLVVVNKDGELVRRVYGKALDESQPDVISVPVLDYETAETIFLSWVAPGKEVSKVDGGYDYTLTDKDGKAQGSISFRAIEGETGVKARMSVAEDTDLKQISEVNFVDIDLWPENDAPQKVETRKIYYMDGYELSNYARDAELKSLPFYCLRGNTMGNEGILVWLSPDIESMKYPIAENYMRFALPYLPTESQAQKVLDRLNENRLTRDLMLQDMKYNGHDWYADADTDIFKHTTGNYEFVIGNYYEGWIFDYITCMDIDSYPGELEDVSDHSFCRYRYMQIHIIPPYKK